MQLSLGDFVLSGGEIAGHGAARRGGAAAARRAGRRRQPRSRTASTRRWTACSTARTTPGPRSWRAARRACRTVLLSGHHAQIERWRREQRLALTRASAGPDLIAAARAAGRPRAPPTRPSWPQPASYNHGLSDPLPGRPMPLRCAPRSKTFSVARARSHAGTPMNLIQTLEQEEIARLGKTIPDVRPRRHRHRQRQRRRRHPQARAGLRRRRDRQAQPRPEQRLHRAQDLQRRRRRAHVPDLQPADRQRSKSSAAATCAAPSCTTCASAAASRHASRKSWPEVGIAAARVSRSRTGFACSFDHRPPRRGACGFDPRSICRSLGVDPHLPAGRLAGRADAVRPCAGASARRRSGSRRSAASRSSPTARRRPPRCWSRSSCATSRPCC